MTVVGDEEARLAPSGDCPAHPHRLSGGSGFVEKRRVREGQSREVRDHRLKIQQGFESALGDLRLVGCVRGVPARVLQDVALDHAGNDHVRVAHADEGPEHLILVRHGLQVLEELELAERTAILSGKRGQREGLAPDRGRNRRVRESLEGRVAEGREHVGHVPFARADVTAREGVRRIQPGIRHPHRVAAARHTGRIKRRSGAQRRARSPCRRSSGS